MAKKFTMVLIACVSLLLGMTFVSCEQPGNSTTTTNPKDDATLASVTIDGTAVAAADMPTANAAYESAVAKVVNFGNAKPATITLVATATDTKAALKYALSSSNTTVPAAADWKDSGAVSEFANGDYMVVRVIAEDGIATLYYKWQISFGSAATSTLAAADGLIIAGVSTSAYGTPAGAADSEGIVNGAISLNNTQTANGKSIVVNVSDANLTGVALSTNSTNSDTAAPTAWNELTKDSTVSTRWTGSLSGTALANNRRIYIRLSAGDATTFYRIQVTSVGATATLSALTINDVAVPPAGRGTPAGSWNAADLVAGELVTAITPAMTVAPTWGAGGTNDVTYAKTSSFPVTTEPTWGASGDLTGITAGNYIWIRTVNGDYRNVYVVQVRPEPFTLTIGGKAVAWADLGTSWTTGTLALTNMGTVVLDQAATANAAAGVAIDPSIVGATAVIAKYTIPYTQANIAIADFTGATSSLAAGAFTEKDIVQVKYTAPGATTPVYYAVNIRRTVNIPYVARNAIDMELAAATEVAWATAPTLPLDRVYSTDSAGWASVTDYTAATPSTIKVLWNEDGIYYFATVNDKTASTGTDHLCDNIEFFVAENYTLGATGNWNNVGGQYRVERGGVVSGDTTARVTSKVVSTADGYTIKARIAWGTAAATVGTWADGQLIGIDIQLAYSRATGARDACIMWNNFIAGSYQQKGRTGLAYLKK